MDPGNSSAGISTSPDNKYGDRNSCHRVQITNQIVIARRRSRRSNPEAADSAFVAPGLLRLRLAMTVLRNWNTVTGAPVTVFCHRIHSGKIFSRRDAEGYAGVAGSCSLSLRCLCRAKPGKKEEGVSGSLGPCAASQHLCVSAPLRESFLLFFSASPNSSPSRLRRNGILAHEIASPRSARTGLEHGDRSSCHRI